MNKKTPIEEIVGKIHSENCKSVTRRLLANIEIHHKEELQRVREECEKRTGNYIHISEVNKQKREIQIALQKIGCDLLPIKGKKKHNMAVMRVSNGMLKSLTPKDQL